MRTNHRAGASATMTSAWLVAAAAAVGLLATIALFHPSFAHAAGNPAPVISTTKTSLGQVLVDSRGRRCTCSRRIAHQRARAPGSVRRSGRR
jgi:hypothetical protein